MLRYQKIDVSEGIDVNKTSASKECELCCYWFFNGIGFKLEENVLNLKKMSWFNNNSSFFKKYSDIERKRKYF